MKIQGAVVLSQTDKDDQRHESHFECSPRAFDSDPKDHKNAQYISSSRVVVHHAAVGVDANWVVHRG